MLAGRNIRYYLETSLIYTGMGLFALIVVLPFVHVAARSFSAGGPVHIWPARFSARAYRRLIGAGYFWLAYRNSVIITVVGTTIQMGLTVLTAYPLSRSYLPGRGFLMMLVVLEMIFPPGLIPFYLTVRQLRLIDSWWALILPYAINTFNMIVLKSYFQAVPKELEESAVIDGANDVQVLLSVMLPLAMPVVLTLALFYAVANWNLYLPAVFFINDGYKQPLQVVLRGLVRTGTSAFEAASLVMAALPMLVAYPLIQRYFVRGLTLGALSG